MADRIPLRRGTITRIDSLGVYCSISTLGTPQQEFGPMDSGHFDLRIGDRVIVGQAGYETENFVIVTSLTPRPMPITSIYYFETTADRDAILPSPVVPTFAYVDDDQTIYIYSDEGGSSWRKVNWGINGVFTGDITFASKVLLSDSTKQVNIGNSASTASFASQRTTNTNNVLSARVSGDTLNRLEVRADGLHAWGTGAAAVDTNLYRNGVGALKTDGSFQSASLTTSGIVASSLSADIIPLTDLSDVLISGASAGHVLEFNGTRWVNMNLASNDLSDVVVSSPSTGQTYRHNGTNFVNSKLATTDLSDVSNTGIATGLTMMWDGTNWIPYAFKEVALEYAGAVNNYTSTTLVDFYMPVGSTSVSVTKKFSSTVSDLKAVLSVTGFHNTAGSKVTLGLRRDSTTDHDDLWAYVFNATSDHRTWNWPRRITGLNAATYSFKLRVKTSAGTFSIDTNDTIVLTIVEVLK